jgi:hypothetical protein
VKAERIAEIMSRALTDLEAIAGAGGREIAIARTKMEEASFFAKKAMASRIDNRQ